MQNLIEISWEGVIFMSVTRLVMNGLDTWHGQLMFDVHTGGFTCTQKWPKYDYPLGAKIKNVCFYALNILMIWSTHMQLLESLMFIL
jgi:hypothetical protein